MNKKLFPALVFFTLALLSVPLAYTALRCHSYAHAPVRFAVDMTLRTLLLALPFCLSVAGVGFYKSKDWARRAALYLALILVGIIVCIIILM